MALVVALLNGLSLTLPAPTVPAFYQQDDTESEMLGELSTVTNNALQLKGQVGNFSVNNISNSDMYPR